MVDTSALLVACDARHPAQEATARVLSANEPRLLSPLILAEIDYLLGRRVGWHAQLAFAKQVGAGAYQLEPWNQEDMEKACGVMDRYRDLGISLADASIVVLAARHHTTRIATFDERHFRALRPLTGRSFTCLPKDR